jgi:EAL domain-containing protein (putative c-di-GMP-specific phosphodiesterase class I)
MPELAPMPHRAPLFQAAPAPDAPFLALEPHWGQPRSLMAGQDTAQVLGEDAGQLSVLKRAIRNCELTLRFQPIVSLQERLPCGVEARPSWQDPQRRMRSADALMELADRHGLVSSLISAQTEQACALVEALSSRSYGTEPATVSLNIATRYLCDRAVVEDIVGVVSRTSIDPSRLFIVLNEATSLRPRAQIHGPLLALRAAGVQLALGQFGTGSWSMTDLRDFAVSSLTIDTTFVAGLPQSSDDHAIASSLVHLAHGLGLLCMAEGVKDHSQASVLDAIGCDRGVGPYWGPPVPEAEVELLLKCLGQSRLQPVGRRR